MTLLTTLNPESSRPGVPREIFVRTPANWSRGSTGTLTIPTPESAQVGDCLVYVYTTTDLTAGNSGVPDEFTVLFSGGSTTRGHIRIGYKFATQTDIQRTWTFTSPDIATGSSGVVNLFAISGVDPNSPLGMVEGAGAAAGSATQPPFQSRTSTADNSLAVYIGGHWNSTQAVNYTGRSVAITTYTGMSTTAANIAGTFIGIEHLPTAGTATGTRVYALNAASNYVTSTLIFDPQLVAQGTPGKRRRYYDNTAVFAAIDAATTLAELNSALSVIETDYGIRNLGTITETTYSTREWTNPTIDNPKLKPAIKDVLDGLAMYPTEYIKLIGMPNLSFVSNIINPSNPDGNIGGFTGQASLWLDIEEYGNVGLQYLFHHEFFHVQANQFTARINNMQAAWIGNNPAGFTYTSDYQNPPYAGQWPTGFVRDYARSSYGEDLAETAAYILDPNKQELLAEMIATDPGIAGKVALIKDFWRLRSNNVMSGETYYQQVTTKPLEPMSVYAGYIAPLTTAAQEAGYDSAEANTPPMTQHSYWGYAVNAAGDAVQVMAPTVTPEVSRSIALQNSGNEAYPAITNHRNGVWTNDQETMLADPAKRSAFITSAVNLAVSNNFAGIDIDFEDTSSVYRDQHSAFASDLGDALHAQGKKLNFTVFAKENDAGYNTAERNGSQNYAAIGAASDTVRIMAYDWNWSTAPTAGAIAPIGWVTSAMNYAVTQITPTKIVLGCALWGYDWPVAAGGTNHGTTTGAATNRTYAEIQALITQYNITPTWDDTDKAYWFRYTVGSQVREVWYEDARSIRAKYELAESLGLAGLMFWRLGDEDPNVWTKGIGPLPKAETVQFSNWTANADKFTPYDANRRIVSGSLEIDAVSIYPQVISTSKYDLTNSYVGSSFVSLPNVSNGSTEAYIGFLDGLNNGASFGWTNGSLFARLITNGSNDNAGWTSYSPTTHKFLRIREASGTIYWEYSADGITWTALRTAAIAFSVTAVTIQFLSGNWNSATTPGKTVFGPVNIFAAQTIGTNTSVDFGAATVSSPPLLAEINEVTTLAGRSPKYELWYSNWSTQQLTVANLNTVSDRGRINYVTWEAFDGVGPTNAAYSYANILAGNHDAIINSTATNIRDYGKTVYLRPFHEMNGNWYPWAIGQNGNTAAQHIQAWNYLRSKFAAVGATNVKWVWSPNINYTGSADLATAYPGDANVDIIAIDGYNWGTTNGNTWTTPSALFDPTFAQITSIAPTKELWIGETSSSEAGGDKAAWIRQFFIWVTNQAKLRNVVWFNLNKEADWRINSSTASTTAFSESIATLTARSDQIGGVQLTGSGTLTASGTALVTRSVALTGSGTLTSAQTPRPVQSTALSGSGALTSAQTPRPVSSATLTGSGTLTAVAVGMSHSRSAALTGSGTLGAQTSTTGTGSAALTGSGALTATAVTVGRTGASNLTGSGTLSGAATQVTASRTAALTGAGTLTTTATPSARGTGTLSGSGTLTVTGVSARLTASAVLSGSGSLTAKDTNDGESFTGTNGSAWPAPWTTVSGTNTIQNNRGQQATAASAWTAAESRANVAYARTRVLATLNFSAATNVSQRVNIRWNPNTGNGYRLIMTPGYSGMQLLKVTGFAETVLQERFDTSWSAGTDYRVRVEAEGTTIRARRWLANTSEPTAWDVIATDSDYTSGDVALVTTSGEVAASAIGTWDDVVVAEIPVEPPLTTVPNPERGFFYYTETHYRADNSGHVPLTEADLNTQYANGYRLVFRYYVIEKFRTQDTIDQAYLDLVAADMTAARNAGMKLIARFTYATDGNMTPPYNADAPRARVVGHVQQLAPVLNANADIIDSIQAGLIGMWGEWYYTDNYGDQGTTTPEQWADRKAVFDALMALDSRIMILQRYIGVMRRYIEDDPTNTNYTTRMGHHNDALFAPFADYGTYTTFTSYSEAQNRAWLENRQSQTIHFPQGGESAVGNPPQSLYPNAKLDMQAYRFSFLNPIYHQDVMNSWSAEEKADASARLGYRLALSNISATTNGGNVDLSFTVTNAGFAAPYRNHPIKVDFVSGGGTITRDFVADIRTWATGTTVVTGSVAAPPSGTYSVHLRVIDPSTSLQTNPKYSIQFANNGMFDAATGRNNLGVQVTSTVVPTAAVSLTGSGTLTATGTASARGSVNLTGSGTLAAVAVGMSHARSATLAGSGTLGFQTRVSGAASVSLTGSGALSAVGVAQSFTTSVNLSGSGTLSTTRVAGASGSATLSGSGSLTATGTASARGSVNLTGSGTLGAAQGSISATRSVSLTGSGTLSPVATGMSHSRSASFDGSGSLGFQTQVSGQASTSLTGSGTLTASGVAQSFTTAVALTGSGTLTTTRVAGTSTSAALSGSGSLTASGLATTSASVSLTGSGTLTSAVNSVSATRNVALTGSGSLTGTAVGMSHSRSASFTGSGTLGTQTTATGTASTSLTGSGALTATGEVKSLTGTATLSGSGALSSTRTVATSTSVSLAGSGTLTVTATPIYSAAVAFTGSGTLGVTTGALNITRSVALTGSGTLAGAIIGQSHSRAAGLSGSGSLGTQTQASGQASTALTGSGTLAATGTVQSLSGSATLTGAGTLTASGNASATGTASLSGSGALSSTRVAGASTAAALSGSGTLTSTVGAVSRTGAGSFTGTGTLNAVVTGVSHTATVNFTGSGTLTPTTGAVSATQTVTLTGSGTLGTQTNVTGTASAALSGSGTLSAVAGEVTRTASAFFTGSGTLSSVQTGVGLSRAVALSGSGTLSSARIANTVGSATLSGSGTLASQSTPRLTGSASTSGSGTLGLSASGVALSGAASLTGEGNLDSVASGMGHAAVGTFNGLGGLSVETSTAGATSATFDGSGTLSPTVGTVGRTQAVELSGSGLLDGNATGINASGVATLSGAGNLASAGTPTITRGAGFTGSGQLTAAAVTVSRTATAVFSGSGSLSPAVTAVSARGNAALTGSGSVSGLAVGMSHASTAEFGGEGTLGYQTSISGAGNASLEGSGTLNAAVAAQILRSAGLSGSGTLTSSARISASRTANLTGSGSLTTTRVPSVPVAVNTSGSGTLTTSSSVSAQQDVALSGSGVLSSTETPATSVAVALAGTGTLTAVATLVSQTETADFGGDGLLTPQTETSGAVLAPMSGEGELKAVGVVTVTGSGVFTGSGTLSAATRITAAGNAALSGSGTLAGTARVHTSRGVALTGSGTLSATGRVTASGTATFSGSGNLAVTDNASSTGSATFSGSGTLTATTRISAQGVASFSGEGAVGVATRTTGIATAFTSGEGTLSAVGQPSIRRSASFSGSGVLSALSDRVSAAASAVFAGIGSLTAGTKVDARAAIELSGAGNLTASGRPTLSAAVPLDGEGVLDAEVQANAQSVAILTGQGLLEANGEFVATQTVDLSGSGVLSITDRTIRTDVVYFTGAGRLSARTIYVPPVGPDPDIAEEIDGTLVDSNYAGRLAGGNYSMALGESTIRGTILDSNHERFDGKLVDTTL